LKEALKADRARIQVGRISHFGLLELSRQRLRPSLIEANYRQCSHCGGSGLVRSTESAAVYALRMLEEEGGRQRSSEVTITVHPDVALYLLNYKRDSLASIEGRYRIRIFVLGDAHLVPPNIRLDRVKATRDDSEIPHREPMREIEHARPAVIEADVEVEEDEPEEEKPAREPRHDRNRDSNRDGGREGGRDGGREGGRDVGRDGGRDNANRDENGGRKRRRRRRRRGGEGRNPDGSPNLTPSNESVTASEAPLAQSLEAGEGQHEANGDQTPGTPGEERPGRDDQARRGRRRGRRGGRRRRRGGEPGSEPGAMQNGGAENFSGEENGQQDSPRAENESPAYVAAVASTPEPSDSSEGGSGESGAGRFLRAITKPWRRDDSPAEASAAPAPQPPSPPQSAPVAAPPPAPEAPPGPSKSGWWDSKN